MNNIFNNIGKNILGKKRNRMPWNINKNNVNTMNRPIVNTFGNCNRMFNNVSVNRNSLYKKDTRSRNNVEEGYAYFGGDYKLFQPVRIKINRKSTKEFPDSDPFEDLRPSYTGWENRFKTPLSFRTKESSNEVQINNLVASEFNEAMKDKDFSNNLKNGLSFLKSKGLDENTRLTGAKGYNLEGPSKVSKLFPDIFSRKNLTEEERKKLEKEALTFDKSDDEYIKKLEYEKERKKEKAIAKAFSDKFPLVSSETIKDDGGREYTQEDIEKIYKHVYDNTGSYSSRYKAASIAFGIPVKDIIKLYNIKQEEFIPRDKLRKPMYFGEPTKKQVELRELLGTKPPFMPPDYRGQKFPRVPSYEYMAGLIKNSDGDLEKLSKTYRIPLAKLESVQRRLQGAFKRGI